MNILTINHISKKFGATKALDDVSFATQNGVTALLGNNGAGKTTLINIIVGLLTPDSGQVELEGLTVSSSGKKYREKLGFLPQDCSLYDNYSAYDFLEYIGYLKGISKKACKLRIEKYMKILGLWEHQKKKIVQYSGGMKHRLGIVQAILNEPDLLILDEPTTGLDFNERKTFKSLIKEYSIEHSVILSTHILSDVEDLADHVIIINNGKLIRDVMLSAKDSIAAIYEESLEIGEN